MSSRALRTTSIVERATTAMNGRSEALGGWVVSRGEQEDEGGLAGNDRIRGFDPIIGVYLNNAPIDDDWLKRLGRLSSLNELILTGTQITDDGLRHLAGLSRLQYLSLSETQISDNGIKHLTGLNGLRYLFLNGTQISDDSVEKLQRALPRCQISR